MSSIYDFVDFLPLAMQRLITAIVYILIGYFLSKILATLAGQLMSLVVSTARGDGAPLDKRISRFVFWTSWLIFVSLAYNQLPLLSLSLNQWRINSANLPIQLLILAGAGLFIPFESKVFITLKKYSERLRVRLPQPIAKSLRFIAIYFGWMFIAAIAGIALDSPNTIFWKMMATVMLFCLGILFANIVKQVTLSLFEISNSRQIYIAKLLYYGVLLSFLVTGIRLWAA